MQKAPCCGAVGAAALVGCNSSLRVSINRISGPEAHSADQAHALRSQEPQPETAQSQPQSLTFCVTASKHLILIPESQALSISRRDSGSQADLVSGSQLRQRRVSELPRTVALRHCAIRAEYFRQFSASTSYHTTYQSTTRY